MQHVLTAFAFAFFVAACSTANDPSEDMTGDESDQGTEVSELRSDTTSRTTLNFEGTCDFLRNCSTFSRNPPQPDMVQWGCEGWQVCSNADLFLAAPKLVNVNGRSVRPCGMRVEVCRPGGACVIGIVRDISDRAVWEASSGVFDALDLSHGLTGRCSGYGRAPVTLKLVDGR